jgi:RNA polymerase sigma factor (sigma-70 family)
MNISLEEFLIKNKGFINIQASFYSKYTSDLGIEFDDLYQVGCLALIEKYDDYDQEKGKISTYSHWVIRTAMLNYINKNACITYVPINSAWLVNKIAVETALFYKENGRKPTKDELYNCVKNKLNNTKLSVDLFDKLEKILLFHHKRKQKSLNETIDSIPGSGYQRYYDFEEDENILMNCIKDDYDLEEEVISKVFLEETVNMLKNGDKLDYDIFMETLGLNDNIPKTRKFLAQQYGMPFQTIDKRYHKTLNKIKSKM